MPEKKFWTTKKKAVVAGTAYAAAVGLLLIPRPASAAYRKVAAFDGFGFGFVTSQTAPATIEVSGSVVDSDGVHQAGVTLYFFVDGTYIQSLATDANGAFSAQYTFTVPGNHYATVSDSPEVPPPP